MGKRLAWVLAAVALAGAGPVSGQTADSGTPRGDSLISMGLGLGVPVSNLDLGRFGGVGQSPGGAGFTAGPQYLYEVTPNWGLGGELLFTDFTDKAFVLPRFGATIGSTLLTMQGVARYLFTPRRTLSPYVLGALGLNRFSARIHETQDPTDVLLDTDSTGVALALGAGLQAELTERLVGGGEARWSFNTLDSGKFGSSSMSALQFLARLGWRF